MLTSKALWLGLSALYYTLLVTVQLRYPGLFADKSALGWFRSLNWMYVLGFAGFGVVLQGAITRTLNALSTSLWRPLMLCLGAALALLNAVMLRWWAGLPMDMELWFSALLGLALVAMFARVLPEALLWRWYGLHT